MLSMIRSGILAAAVLAIGFVAAPAAADTVSYNGYTLTNAKSVQIVAPSGIINNGYVGAGRIVLDNVKINGVDSADINAWCIDLNNVLSGHGTYAFGALSNATTANKINALLNGAALTSNFFTTGDANNSAALQVAVWKLVTPGFLMNTSISNGAAINTLSNTFLGYVDDVSNSVWKASTTSTLVTLDPITTTQRLVTLIPNGGGNNNTSTPEPASMALVAVGLAGVALVRRRRRTLH